MARLSSLLLVIILGIPQVAASETRRRGAAPEVSEELRARLNGQDVDDVVSAVREVAELGGSSATQALMDLLRAGPPDAITAAVIEGLGALGDRESIDLLAEYARHRRPEVRVLALQSLSAMRDSRVEAVLIDALRDSNAEVRSTAAVSLGEGGYSESVTILFQAFERGVTEACASIGKLGDAAAAERLTSFLGRGNLTTLLEGLAEFLVRRDFDMDAKLRIVEQLLELAGPDVRRFLVSQVAEIPNTPGNRRLRQAMQDAIAQIPEE
jgi:HEAT repeat protein